MARRSSPAGVLRGAALLGSAFIWIVRVRIGLSLSSHTVVRDHYVLPCRCSGRGRHGARRVPQAVRLAAAVVPGASCLTQALTAQILFARYDVCSTLWLGVENDGGFKAHAWLEIDGVPVIGGTPSNLARYSRLAGYSSTHAAPSPTMAAPRAEDTA